jgi:hypothetical protein
MAAVSCCLILLLIVTISESAITITGYETAESVDYSYVGRALYCSSNSVPLPDVYRWTRVSDGQQTTGQTVTLQSTGSALRYMCQTTHTLTGIIDSRTISLNVFAQASCGGYPIVTELQQQLTSPGYPSDYSNNLNCNWILNASAGYAIYIEFSFFQTEACCDFVTVTDRGTQTQLARLSASVVVPYIVVSYTNSILINFYSDGSVVAKGFSLNYWSVLSNYSQAPGPGSAITITGYETADGVDYSNVGMALYCSSNSAPPPDIYRWTRLNDGQQISGQTLILDRTGSALRYMCQTTHSGSGSTESKTISLNVFASQVTTRRYPSSGIVVANINFYTILSSCLASLLYKLSYNKSL